MVVFAVDLHWPYRLGLPGGAGGHGAARRGVQPRRLLPAAPPHLPAGDHRDHRRLDLPGEHGAGPLRPAAAGAAGLVRDAGPPDRAGLPGQPVPADHRRDAGAGRVQLLVLRAHAARQEAAGDLAGQGDGGAARHPGGGDDHAHLRLFGAARRPGRHPGGADPVRVDPDGRRPSRSRPSRPPSSAASATSRARSSAGWRSA